MNSLATSDKLTGEFVTLDEKRALVARITNVALHRSPRLRELLHYIADRAAAGHSEELTESHIAAEVFGRRDFRSAEDNIVRAAALQLRTKIFQYFETDGRDEPIRLEIPKGGYVPVFNRAAGRPVEMEEARLPEPVAPTLARRGNRRGLILAGVFACATLLNVALWTKDRPVNGHSRQALPPESLCNVLFADPSKRTTVIVTDSALVVLQSLNREMLTLDEYSDGKYISDTASRYPSPALARMFEILRTRQTTSIADLRIASSIMQTYAAPGRDVVISHARNVRIRDFGNPGNFLLLGSKSSNPWNALFEDSLNFRFEKAPLRGVRIHNLRPQTGEEEYYAPKDPLREVGTDYALISLIHNRGGSGRVMMLAGTTMEGTEAAGDFILNPQDLTPVLKLMNAPGIGGLRDCQLLLRSRSIGGAGREARLIAHRIL